MKKITLTFLFALTVFIGNASSENEFGVYRTKEEYMNQHITVIGVIQSSENYNIGMLQVQLKDRAIITINCIREHYFGFKYIDGNDYLLVDGIYARSVIIGNASLLMSPKAGFSADDKEQYTFTPAPNGSLEFYFVRDLSSKASVKFERAIADDKDLLAKYKADKADYGSVINKQIKYLLLFNDKLQKDKKKSGSKKKKSKSKKKKK